MLDRGKKSKIVREQQMISQLTCRTRGDLQVALKFIVATLAATLCKIGRYGSTAAPCLAGQTIEFFPRDPRVTS
jgi:hypothetical protein